MVSLLQRFLNALEEDLYIDNSPLLTQSATGQSMPAIFEAEVYTMLKGDKPTPYFSLSSNKDITTKVTRRVAHEINGKF